MTPPSPATAGSASRPRWVLAADDLLRLPAYRRLWTSVLCGSLGQQVTLLALPLTAALLLQATATQMGLLAAMETLPFVLLSLPAGVWLDRVRKLPVYVAGELVVAASVVSVPLAWWAGVLSMAWLYVVAFMIGLASTVAGSAAQIVLTLVVPRERLVDAHARNALASSSAEVAGPGLAGVLIKLAGAPLALLIDAALLLLSAAVLRGVRLQEALAASATPPHFWRDLREGLRFVSGQPLLVALATVVGLWQMCHNAVLGVQILYASRTLGLSEQTIGLCFVGLGLGTIVSSSLAGWLSARLGPGPSMALGFGVCGLGWSLPAAAAALGLGAPGFAAMLVLVGAGSVVLYINFLALRQAVTPSALQGRMTATMRWLILLPAGPGALAGGWLGEHVSLLATLSAAGALALATAALCAGWTVIRQVRVLPEAAD